MDDHKNASFRHFTDAELLASRQRFDSAGHLLGLAAECAIKHSIMSLSPSTTAPHLHIPELLAVAKKHFQGVRSKQMRLALMAPAIFEGWSITDRYSSDGKVTIREYTRWRIHANRLLGAAGVRKKQR